MDLVIGLDPITGVARSTFEIIAGRNFVTGTRLSEMEYGLAGLNLITLGAGGSVKAGISGFTKLTQKSEKLIRSYETVSGIITRLEQILTAGEKNAIKWGRWTDLEKISSNGREYALINDRLFTQHAVEHMAPGTLGSAAGPKLVQARGIPPPSLSRTS